MSLNNTKIVSVRFIYWFVLGPIWRHVDVEEGEIPDLEFPGMDSDDPFEVKERVIRPFIVPAVRRHDKTTQRMIKDSFRYILNPRMPNTYGGEEFYQRLFNSIIPDFKGPKPIRLFFVWIWDELYGLEDYYTNDLSNYTVDDVTPYETLIREAPK